MTLHLGFVTEISKKYSDNRFIVELIVTKQAINFCVVMQNVSFVEFRGRVILMGYDVMSCYDDVLLVGDDMIMSWWALKSRFLEKRRRGRVEINRNVEREYLENFVVFFSLPQMKTQSFVLLIFIFHIRFGFAEEINCWKTYLNNNFPIL